jgi:hypothetical protein
MSLTLEAELQAAATTALGACAAFQVRISLSLNQPMNTPLPIEVGEVRYDVVGPWSVEQQI